MTKENSIALKYGDRKIEFYLDEKNIIKILHANQVEPLKNSISKLEQLLEKPINSPSLEKLIHKKKAQRILIIVNDITRPTPYHILLPHYLKNSSCLELKKKILFFWLLPVPIGVIPERKV